MKLNIFLFPEFETLDVFGPVEILGRLDAYDLHFISLTGGLVYSSQQVPVMTEKYEKECHGEIFLIPGGMGTRNLIEDPAVLSLIRKMAEEAAYCLTVCTGSALLAATGLLDGKCATSNKRSFSWVKEQRPQVHWQGCARWVVDGKFYTSSGVSAGMDMALGFAADRFGKEKAKELAWRIEYVWNDDKNQDDFMV